MSQYKAPRRDIRFARSELFKMEAFFQSTERWGEVSSELTSAITEECAKFSENVLAPLNAIGDQEGCHLVERKVKTAAGFKEAYQQDVDGGWGLYPGLSHGACCTLEAHGTPQQKMVLVHGVSLGDAR